MASRTLYTCGSCAIGFHNLESQRAHFRSDLHTYNLKRRVAELRPVTAQEFAEKVLALQDQSRQEQERVQFEKPCAVCVRTYYSENSFRNHLRSKRHRENAAATELARRNGDSPADSMISSTFSLGDAEHPAVTASAQEAVVDTPMVADQGDVEDEVDQQIREAPHLELEDCLLCTHTSPSLQDNMQHMKREHGLYIPEQEYLVDPSGLVTYLGEKLSIGHVCIACNGQRWRSLEAVRAHMRDKEHCKIAYSTEQERMELAEFYDFTSSYPTPALTSGEDLDDEGNEEWETDSEASIASEDLGRLQVDSYELQLANGARVGHRSLARYYRQNVHHTPIVPVPRFRAITQYGERLKEAGRLQQGRKRFEENRRKEEFRTRMAFKNNHQKHYRDQLLQ